MDEVPLSRSFEHGGNTQHESRLEPERLADALDDIECRVRSGALDGRDISARQADLVGELLLTNTQTDSSRATGAPERVLQ